MSGDEHYLYSEDGVFSDCGRIDGDCSKCVVQDTCDTRRWMIEDGEYDEYMSYIKKRNKRYWWLKSIIDIKLNLETKKLDK